MWHIHDLHGATGAHPAEQLGVIAFEKLPEIAAKNKRQLDANRELLQDFLAKQHALEYFWPEQGTVIFPKLKGSADVSAFCSRLRNEFDVSVVPGSFFEDPSRIRIGVAGETQAVEASLAQLQRGLRALA